MMTMVRVSDHARIRQKSDDLAGLNLGDVFAKLDQPVGVDQR